MSGRYGNGSDPLAAISTSPEVLATLRRRMTAIELAADTLQVHLASERARVTLHDPAMPPAQVVEAIVGAGFSVPEQVVDLALERPDLDLGVQEARRANNLLRDLLGLKLADAPLPLDRKSVV